MQRIWLVVLAVGLVACARDSEHDLRARLSAWFYLSDLQFFHSKTRCTAAVFGVNMDRTRPTLRVHDDINDAKQAFLADGVSALRATGLSPHDLTDALLMRGRGTMGKEALAAAAQAVPCFDGTPAESQLRDALTRPGAMLAFDAESEGLIILDPDTMRLFYVAGDVW